MDEEPLSDIQTPKETDTIDDRESMIHEEQHPVEEILVDNVEPISHDGIEEVLSEESIKAPEGVVATSGDRQNYISWQMVPWAVSYRVYWNVTANVTTHDSFFETSLLVYWHQGLNNGTAYYYRVSALTDVLESELSQEVSATPQAMSGIAVDLSSNLGPMSTKATGFHGGLNNDTPDNMIYPIKPGFIRRIGGSNAWQRARELNITLIQLLAGYDFQGNWSGWVDHVTSKVNEVRSQNVLYHYDVWNEPDLDQFWSGSDQAFFQWWAETYLLLKSLDPQALVAGPSTAWFSSGYMNNFLSYVRTNYNVSPDILCWHEMDTATPQALQNNYQTASNIINDLGLSMPLVHNNEAIGSGQTTRPSAAIVHAAHSHRNHTLGMARAYWSDFESNAVKKLNHLLDDALAPRSNWWAHQRYATMTGDTLLVLFDNVGDAIASRDSDQAKVYLLVGKYASGNGPTFLLTQVASLGFIGDTARVVGQRIAHSGKAASPEPVITFDQTVAVVANTITFTLSDMEQYDGYFLTITNHPASLAR